MRPLVAVLFLFAILFSVGIASCGKVNNVQVGGSRERYLMPMEEITCNDGDVITLAVAEARLNVSGILKFSTRLYHYRGKAMFPGPTIRMIAGTRCTVVIENQLNATSAAGNCAYHSNTYHCPDTTNLHTHGLHVSPVQDDVKSHVTPGTYHNYVYDIPDNHMMGTFFYHAHYHGATSLQVMGGMAGILFVDPNPSTNTYLYPTDISDLYDSCNVHNLMLSHMHFASDPSWYLSGFTSSTYQEVSQAYQLAPEGIQTIDPNVTFLTEEILNDFYVVNGQYQPIVHIQPATANLLRIVNAGIARTLELEMVDTANHCNMTLLARDGVFHPIPYQDLDAIVLAPATRADVVIHCDSTAAGSSIVVRSYNSSDRTPAINVGTNRHTQDIVWTFEISNYISHSALAVPTSQVVFPSYLTNVTLANLTAPTIPLQFFHLASTTSNTGESGFINNTQFNGFESSFYFATLCLDGVYEFHLFPPGGGIQNPNSQFPFHPYHQHINHFMVTSVYTLNMTAGKDIVRIGEWRDTIPLFSNLGAGTGTLIRFSPMNYTGQMVIHCHLTQHEDSGMMGLYLIQNC